MLIYKTNKYTLLLLMTAFFWNSCFSLSFPIKKVQKFPFKLKENFYQSWIINDEEKGTDIVLELTSVKKGVTFDSIVFRGIKMKAFVTPVKNGVVLKSILPSGKSKIRLGFEAVDLPDQLIYNQNDQRKTLPLTNLVRKKTRYFPVH